MSRRRTAIASTPAAPGVDPDILALALAIARGAARHDHAQEIAPAKQIIPNKSAVSR